MINQDFINQILLHVDSEMCLIIYKLYLRVNHLCIFNHYTCNINCTFILQVKSLEVKYSLDHTPDVFVLRKEKCLQKGNVFYFHTDHTESYSEINKEIAKMFSVSDERCSRDIR